MTTPEQSKESGWIYRHLPLLGGLSGVMALVGFCWSYLLLPLRVTALEDGQKKQNSDIVAIQSDNMQRREMLASVIATLAQINDRTKRIEDHIIPPSK